MAACCGDKSCKVYQFKYSAPPHTKCWISTTTQECSGEQGWPEVLDCRADMRHTYDLGTTWPLIMDFFEAHR